MPKRCVVPKCKSGSRVQAKCSLFHVPKDVVTWKKWEDAIPGIIKLNRSDVVCEKHFKEGDIRREWVKFDQDGKVIAQVTYKHPQLKELAVPSKFGNAMIGKENCVPFHEYAKAPDNEKITVINDVTNRLPSAPGCGTDSLEVPTSMEVSSELPVTETVFPEILVEVSPSVEINEAHVSLPPPVTGLSLSPMEESTCGPILDFFAPRTSPEVLTPRDFNQGVSEENTSANNDLYQYLPEEWGLQNVRTSVVHETVFTYVVMKTENDVRCPVVQKAVKLDADGTLQYFVYGRHVDPQVINLEQTLSGKEALKPLLIKFKGMKICTGIGDVDVCFIRPGTAFQDHVDKWRSTGCSLVSKKKRCEACLKTRKCIQQRTTRLKNTSAMIRITNFSNPVEVRKLSAMRLKLRRERRQKIRALEREKQLKMHIKAQEAEMASIQDTIIDKKLTELKISSSQKLVVKEIIAAAKKTDARGRRYTDEWIMLCMLMNIRSPRDYEFLRKNNILPLPCTRTIRSYFSLINSKCGFDEEFAELLKKHFQSKTSLQRHGILILDEINLRKSVAVCSKDLTYSGLTDFGEDGQKSTDIKDQATHGLVVMFQPLADVYTQPIAVFASKNPVKGDELAKIVLKAISYVEQCGASIHGVVADGAATNARMWSVLGVRGTMDNTKTWFVHPMDNDRKVFVFSDVCHVIKNIRNRLYNKEKLRTKSTANYVRWRYFTELYHLDKDHPGNARACPKVTNRHVVLDNTSKMRVKLATQIFSNSVADGLKFYGSHGCEGLRGCEETILFCKRVNDMFDAMNRKSPNQGLTELSSDFKILEDSLCWLNEWESAVISQDIPAEEFLTTETSRGLRISLQSTMELCRYLIDNFGFKYLLTGKVNQDNLEKFFGTIRQCAGSNDHPNCPTFLQLYKLLSVYSVIKPPKYGNCTVMSDSRPPTLISISEIKAIYGNKSEGKSAEYLRKIKAKLDEVLQHEDWEADDIIDPQSEHDYALSSILDCVIYYVTGYLCKQVLKKFQSCAACEEAVRFKTACGSSESQLVAMKSRGGLIHANLHFFHLIRHVEASFAKYCTRSDVFELTLDDVLNTYTFTFPCREHASEILSYAIVYYLRLRMRQYVHQENLKLQKKFVVKKKLSKLTNE